MRHQGSGVPRDTVELPRGHPRASEALEQRRRPGTSRTIRTELIHSRGSCRAGSGSAGHAVQS